MKDSRDVVFEMTEDFKLNSESVLRVKGGESSSQFQWYTIAKIEL